ncbi:hypothetical protein AC338_000880 [Salmonella enterica subsp. enterica]|nr:hypothetical protein [Salmonella enterica subsp. enterica]EAX2272926.1 hypothetical protein [Salmonella enterica]ECD5353257.1 hypothetical protein [Salmonella enterica subsp. enterica serovar Telaviv]EDS3106726.1 hypothetical protein [Salmonella enterica subsp. enterica serovar Cullingworth]HBM0001168.1 hypothetical protein [Salmonella enterica subsp. enterica serovar Gozo]
MNKTVYVPSYFQPIYKEVTVKVPTGNTKRFLGFIDIEEKIRKKEVVQEGWSDCQVDGENAHLNCRGPMLMPICSHFCPGLSTSVLSTQMDALRLGISVRHCRA